MTAALRTVIAANRAGAPVAIPSVCSAHGPALRASLLLAEELDRPIVVEATSNQVNQEGGYAGMVPAEFVSFVNAIADKADVDRARLSFGGDHLGPQAWKDLPADQAMARAETMVDGYVRAGFSKIHLDCSEGCANEPAQVGDALAAGRSAILAAACRAAAGDGRDLLYVIGTEVPPPGGARHDAEGAVAPTTPAAAGATLAAHAAAFADAGLDTEFARVGALVVQPGVEFAPLHVHHLPADRDPGLRQVMMGRDGLCLEAHSTDYQRAPAYPRLAELGFAFQKVGPALTFAWRQALYALDALRGLAGWGAPIVPPVLEALMTRDPRHWQGHYHGDATQQHLQRHFAYSDRIRYYWPQAAAVQAVAALQDDLSDRPLPEPLLLQAFPQALLDRAEALSGDRVTAILAAAVQMALLPYFFADGATRAKGRSQ